MNRPFALIIDDEPREEALVALLNARGVDARYLHPGQVTERSLRGVTLIVLDEYLSDWPDRDDSDLPASLRVQDGIALAAVLRAHLDSRGYDTLAVPQRTGIVLRSGQLDHLAAGLPRADRASTVAARYDLEWVMQKGEEQDGQTESDLIVSLAHAIDALPATWDASAAAAQTDWLALPDLPWHDTALWQVEQCRPPRAILAELSAGRAWMRWFTSSVLAFPTFLIDDLRAATSLGLTLDGFTDLISGSSSISRQLQDAEYRGQLARLEGRRWWRAGLRSLVEEIAADIPTRSAAELGDALARLHGTHLDTLHLTDPVLTIDVDHVTQSIPIEITAAVRIQPDGWPVYADDPWIPSDTRDNSPLHGLVVLDDRDGLGGHLEP